MHPLDIIQSFPTAIWTVPLGVLMFFWLLTILGAFDIDMFDLDADAGPELDADADLEAGGGHGLLHDVSEALALGTVPLTVVVSCIVTFGWIASVLGEVTIAGPARELVGPWVYGPIMLIATFLGAVWLTTKAVKPLKPIFITHTQHEGDSLLGQVAVLSSSQVDATFGTALARAADGTSLNLRVICDMPNRLVTGDELTIVAFDAEQKHYVVAPLDPSKRLPVEPAVDPAPGAAERLPSDPLTGRDGRPNDPSGDPA